MNVIKGHDLDINNTVVFEDAVSGVQSAKAGGFYTIGISRSNNTFELRKAGADLVVDDLQELHFSVTEGLIKSDSNVMNLFKSISVSSFYLVISYILRFSLTYFIARAVSVGEMGIYSWAITAFGVFSIIIIFGQDFFLLKEFRVCK